MIENDDDLTIDGADLLLQIRNSLDQGHPGDHLVGEPAGDVTVTDIPPPGGRWTPTTDAPSSDSTTGRPGGLSRLQVGIVAGTFVLGAALGLMVGLARSGGSDDSPAVSPPLADTLGE